VVGMGWRVSHECRHAETCYTNRAPNRAQ